MVCRTQVEVINFGSNDVELWVAGRRDPVFVPYEDIPYYIRGYMYNGSIHHARFDHENLSFAEWE